MSIIKLLIKINIIQSSKSKKAKQYWQPTMFRVISSTQIKTSFKFLVSIFSFKDFLALFSLLFIYFFVFFFLYFDLIIFFRSTAHEKIRKLKNLEIIMFKLCAEMNKIKNCSQNFFIFKNRSDL